MTKVMGVLNVTKDSFFDGGRYQDLSNASKQIDLMFEEGVDILDLGACSTRPGAKLVSESEEIAALGPVLNYIKRRYPNMPVSIDTFRSSVAQWAYDEFRVEIINDISGGTMDQKMFETMANTKCSYVLMHTRGTPSTMQSLTQYDDIMQEIIVFFAKQKDELHSLGVLDIIIDPGFGFAKTMEQNYLILKKLDYLKLLELPILVGFSRKSMIQKTLNCDAQESLNGTSVLNTIALHNGADILRVHDVKEAKECIKIFRQYENSN